MSKHNNESFKFGSELLLAKISTLLKSQASLLDELPIECNSRRFNVARPLIMGIASNTKAVIELAQLGFGNEVYPILRSLLERIVTFYYLHVCSEEELQNYVDYSVHKSYHNFNRSININDKQVIVETTPKIDLDKNQDIKKIVDKFTSKVKKKPLTRWSNTSIETKLKEIDKTGKIDLFLLLMALEGVYDNGSEALHGTLYGCMFHLGSFEPNIRKLKVKDRGSYFRGSYTTEFLLFALIISDL